MSKKTSHIPLAGEHPIPSRAAVGAAFNPSRKICGFYPPDVVSRQRGLTEGQKRLYERAVRWSGNNGIFWRGFKSMAEALGKSERQVKSDMAALERAGLIKHHRRQRNSNVYSFLWQPMFDMQPTALQEGIPKVQDSHLEVQNNVVLEVQSTAHESSQIESSPLVTPDIKRIPVGTSQEQRSTASPSMPFSREEPKSDILLPPGISLQEQNLPLEENRERGWSPKELAEVRRRIVAFWGREPDDGFEISVMLRAGGVSAAAVCELIDRKHANPNCRRGGRWAPESQNWFLAIVEREFGVSRLPEPPAAPHADHRIDQDELEWGLEALELPDAPASAGNRRRA